MSEHLHDKHPVPQALSKALLELRAELTSQAEQQIIANGAQKEEALNVQQIVDKQTKDLKVNTFINVKTTLGATWIMKAGVTLS